TPCTPRRATAKPRSPASRCSTTQYRTSTSSCSRPPRSSRSPEASEAVERREAGGAAVGIEKVRVHPPQRQAFGRAGVLLRMMTEVPGRARPDALLLVPPVECLRAQAEQVEPCLDVDHRVGVFGSEPRVLARETEAHVSCEHARAVAVRAHLPGPPL